MPLSNADSIAMENVSTSVSSTITVFTSAVVTSNNRFISLADVTSTMSDVASNVTSDSETDV